MSTLSVKKSLKLVIIVEQFAAGEKYFARAKILEAIWK